MTDTLRLLETAAEALPLHVVTQEHLQDWCAGPGAPWSAWIAASGFKAAIGDALLLPGPDGQCVGALAGLGSAKTRAREAFALAAIRPALPARAFFLVHDLSTADLTEHVLGWLLAGYTFRRYRSPAPAMAQLIAPAGVDVAHLHAFADAEALARDLINTPANDLGPDGLEDAATLLAKRHDAQVQVTRGDDLLDANLPLIHAVGGASPRAPRLIDMRHGTTGPRLTLVGKGVCFDTGGLNLKPGTSIGLMKKDMGGAACVLALAHMILQSGWPVQLRVLIPAVENAVSGNAMRPGDILTARNGMTVEINNTDAEGRLILADALALADDEAPDMLICLATLTGAARVAMGPDIVPVFTREDTFAQALVASGRQMRDPVWPLPLFAGYEAMIEPGIADLDNAPGGGMAGAITAALFLNRFAPQAKGFAHFDMYGWQPKSAPGFPKGGRLQAARALFAALPGALGL